MIILTTLNWFNFSSYQIPVTLQKMGSGIPFQGPCDPHPEKKSYTLIYQIKLKGLKAC